jgi:RluA family pseudouridine synthase
MARLKVLYRDRDLVVIHKPSGMKTMRDSAKEKEASAFDVVKKTFGEATVFPVHRLDQGTDGILLFAFRADVANLLQKAFREESVKKTYWALVWGDTPTKGEWKKPVPEKDGGTQRALTKFRTLGRFETDVGTETETQTDTTPPRSGRPFSWIECEPKTGRFHQIRFHAADAGFPLVGDEEYGGKELLQASKRELGLSRIALTAVRLELKHPTRRKPMRIETFPETALGKLLDALERSR